MWMVYFVCWAGVCIGIEIYTGVILWSSVAAVRYENRIVQRVYWLFCLGKVSVVVKPYGYKYCVEAFIM